jgi:hypothetical protein
LDIFNDHLAVLGGINESIVDIKSLTSFFDKFSENLEIESISHISNSHLSTTSPLRKKFDDLNYIKLRYSENKKEIESNFDGIAFFIKLKSAVSVLGRRFDKSEIFYEPECYFIQDVGENFILTKLVSAIPKRYFNLDLLGGTHSKFYLLNGLQKPLGNLPWRRAFKRLRLFVSDKNSFKCSLKVDNRDAQEMDVIINGTKVLSLVLGHKWKSLDLDLTNFDAKVVLEFVLNQNKSTDSFFLISPLDYRELNSFDLARDVEKLKHALLTFFTKRARMIYRFLKKCHD